VRWNAIVLALAAGCGSGGGRAIDAGAHDAPMPVVDGPRADGPAGSVDAPADGSSPDSVVSDASVPDASTLDADLPDALAMCGDLRLWYRFDETSGMTFDSSGCGNTGAPSAVTRGEPGRIGHAYRFNQPGTTNAHVLVPDAPAISDLGMLTIEAWVRHTGGNLEAVLDHGDASGGDPFIFHTGTVRDPALTTGFYPTCDGMGTVLSMATLPLDAWTHIAVTDDNSTGEVLFYQDGVQSGSGTGYMNMGHMCDNDEAMIVGGVDTAGTWGWQGWIDDLRVWAVLRTQAEICADAGGTPGPGTCALP
jgi:concanavalin A-like lectin/glucanase superfamily protein